MRPVPANFPRITSGLIYRDAARMVYVDDIEAHCAQARAHGARIVDEIATHDYGDDYWADRSYGALDPEGHLWWFTQRIRG